MKFECVICKEKMEHTVEQLKAIYGFIDGIPTVAELCDIISRHKRKTCRGGSVDGKVDSGEGSGKESGEGSGSGKEGDKKKYHLFVITNDERDVLDPIVNIHKESKLVVQELENNIKQENEIIEKLKKELEEHSEKKTKLENNSIESGMAVDKSLNRFEELYGHDSIELWS